MNGMYYLFFQIWFWLLISFALGFICHWLFCCRGHKEEPQEDLGIVNTHAPTETIVEEPKTVQISDNWKPMLFAQAPGASDDLKRIKGIGAVIEKTLNELGVYQFEQISTWDENNCAWVDNFLAFPGRISREDWVNQAKALARGEVTDFAKRVDKGDVDYKS